MRDTLAGVFNDRDSYRFAYRSLTPWLLFWAALTLLLGVAVRRLVLPAQWLALPGRWRARRAARAAARQAQQPQPAMAQALLAARQDARRSGREAAQDAPPPSVPRFATSAPTAPVPLKPLVPDRPAHEPRTSSASATATAGAPPPSRPLSTAELLLARRRGRR